MRFGRGARRHRDAYSDATSTSSKLPQHHVEPQSTASARQRRYADHAASRLVQELESRGYDPATGGDLLRYNTRSFETQEDDRYDLQQRSEDDWDGEYSDERDEIERDSFSEVSYDSVFEEESNSETRFVGSRRNETAHSKFSEMSRQSADSYKTDDYEGSGGYSEFSKSSYGDSSAKIEERSDYLNRSTRRRKQPTNMEPASEMAPRHFRPSQHERLSKKHGLHSRSGQGRPSRDQNFDDSLDQRMYNHKMKDILDELDRKKRKLNERRESRQQRERSLKGEEEHLATPRHDLYPKMRDSRNRLQAEDQFYGRAKSRSPPKTREIPTRRSHSESPEKPSRAKSTRKPIPSKHFEKSASPARIKSTLNDRRHSPIRTTTDMDRKRSAAVKSPPKKRKEESDQVKTKGQVTKAEDKKVSKLFRFRLRKSNDEKKQRSEGLLTARHPNIGFSSADAPLSDSERDTESDIGSKANLDPTPLSPASSQDDIPAKNGYRQPDVDSISLPAIKEGEEASIGLPVNRPEKKVTHIQKKKGMWGKRAVSSMTSSTVTPKVSNTEKETDQKPKGQEKPSTGLVSRDQLFQELKEGGLDKRNLRWTHHDYNGSRVGTTIKRDDTEENFEVEPLTEADWGTVSKNPEKPSRYEALNESSEDTPEDTPDCKSEIFHQQRKQQDSPSAFQKMKRKIAGRFRSQKKTKRAMERPRERAGDALSHQPEMPTRTFTIVPLDKNLQQDDLDRLTTGITGDRIEDENYPVSIQASRGSNSQSVAPYESLELQYAGMEAVLTDMGKKQDYSSAVSNVLDAQSRSVQPKKPFSALFTKLFKAPRTIVRRLRQSNTNPAASVDQAWMVGNAPILEYPDSNAQAFDPPSMPSVMEEEFEDDALELAEFEDSGSYISGPHSVDSQGGEFSESKRAPVHHQSGTSTELRDHIDSEDYLYGTPGQENENIIVQTVGSSSMVSSSPLPTKVLSQPNASSRIIEHSQNNQAKFYGTHLSPERGLGVKAPPIQRRNQLSAESFMEDIISGPVAFRKPVAQGGNHSQKVPSDVDSKMSNNRGFTEDASNGPPISEKFAEEPQTLKETVSEKIARIERNIESRIEVTDPQSNKKEVRFSANIARVHEIPEHRRSATAQRKTPQTMPAPKREKTSKTGKSIKARKKRLFAFMRRSGRIKHPTDTSISLSSHSDSISSGSEISESLSKATPEKSVPDPKASVDTTRISQEKTATDAKAATTMTRKRSKSPMRLRQRTTDGQSASEVEEGIELITRRTKQGKNAILIAKPDPKSSTRTGPRGKAQRQNLARKKVLKMNKRRTHGPLRLGLFKKSGKMNKKELGKKGNGKRGRRKLTSRNPSPITTATQESGASISSDEYDSSTVEKQLSRQNQEHGSPTQFPRPNPERSSPATNNTAYRNTALLLDDEDSIESRGTNDDSANSSTAESLFNMDTNMTVATGTSVFTTTGSGDFLSWLMPSIFPPIPVPKRRRRNGMKSDATGDGSIVITDAQWEEILRATETLALQYKEAQAVDDEESVSIDEGTIEKVNNAINVYKNHSRRLGITEKELLFAVRDDDRSLNSNAKSKGTTKDTFSEIFEYFFAPADSGSSHGS